MAGKCYEDIRRVMGVHFRAFGWIGHVCLGDIGVLHLSGLGWDGDMVCYVIYSFLSLDLCVSDECKVVGF
jgi:hypothetical protein